MEMRRPLSLFLCRSFRRACPSFSTFLHFSSLSFCLKLFLPASFLPFFPPTLSPPFPPRPAPPVPHCSASEGADFISDAVRRAASALKGSGSQGITTPLCPHHLSSHPSFHLTDGSVPPLIFPALPPSVLYALVVYNVSISCPWQMKDLFHTANCSLESGAEEV